MTMAYTCLLEIVGFHLLCASTITGFITDMREGRYSFLSEDFEMLLGRMPMTLEDSLTEIYEV